MSELLSVSPFTTRCWWLVVYTAPGELLYLTELPKQHGSLTTLCGNIFAKWVLIIQDPVQKEPSIKDW